MSGRPGAGTFSRRSLHGQVANRIGARILSGELGPGASLPGEGEFASEFGVSRTVMRESIKLLASKGLVESRPKTGTKVRPREQWNTLDPDILIWRLASGDLEGFADQLFELRRIIEPQAAALAAQRATPEDHAIMRRHYDGMAAAVDVESSIQPDFQFHLSILAATRNDLLAALGMVIETALTASFAMSGAAPAAPKLSLPHHLAVLDAIVARDADGARTAMQVLLANASKDIHRAIDEKLVKVPVKLL